MLLALAQINPTVSDLAGNRALILDCYRRAREAAADLVIFPELAVTGYMPRDLLLRPAFVAAADRSLREIAAACDGATAALIGFPQQNPAPAGRPLYNAAVLCRGGRIEHVFRKTLLPSYDVFDESRYFEPGEPRENVLSIASARGGPTERIGVCICEDLWNDADFVSRPLYVDQPVEALTVAGARLLLNISASPFTLGKQAFRERLFGGQAAKFGVPLVVVNQVGGNDELVFDGASCAFAADGRLVARAKAFDEDLLLVELPQAGGGRIEKYPDEIGALHDALVLGLRDYVRKCGFRQVVLGLSGGIDSAVTAALAAAALGPSAVLGAALPSRFSSDHSLSDARLLAANLGIEFQVIPIEPMHAAAEQSLVGPFAGRAADVTEENVQARLRGVLLMALSNKFGRLLLTTGNKSEIAVGYCTLYGDMCGGLAVISDVHKTRVYALAREINRRAGRELIPHGSMEKAPSAELRPNQTDQDSLPPYEMLDAILQGYVDEERSAAELVARGFDPATVADVIRRVDGNEYKRRQAAPGLKVTSRAFGMGRRQPIAVGRGWTD